jgi:hypothetical protein
VLYVYEKQLEEADVLVINKVDTVPASRVAALRGALEARYPAARIIEISARTGANVAAWIDALLTEEGSGRVLEIDYDTYAEGEALLGWLNCTATVAGVVFDGDEFLLAVGSRVHRILASHGLEIAHLKLTLAPASGGGLAVVNATRTDAPAELAFALDAQVDACEVTLNLRAEADPADLEDAVRRAFAEESAARRATVTVTHLERFRPGRPVPTHRMAGTAG